MTKIGKKEGKKSKKTHTQIGLHHISKVLAYKQVQDCKK